MAVTDQINALRALGTDPIRKLVVPRMFAGIIMAPVLTVIADFVGVVGGFFDCDFLLHHLLAILGEHLVCGIPVLVAVERCHLDLRKACQRPSRQDP